MKPIIGLDLDGVIRHNNKSLGTGDIPKEKRNKKDLAQLYQSGQLPKGYYCTKPEDVIFIDGALEALAMFNDMGWDCYVISNQELVDVGIITEDELQKIIVYMDEVVSSNGGNIIKWQYCPHLDSSCFYRKPNPGMFYYLAWQYEINLTQMYYIGDNPSDMEAGKAAGCRTIHIQLPTAESEFRHSPDADEVAGSLFSAACRLVRRHGKER